VEAPSGTVTFLFTDIEGSTRLWQDDEDGMRSALARHDELLRTAIGDHDGYVFSTGGDGFAAAFARAADAVTAAVDAQAALAAERWAGGVELRVRMGVHTGESTERDGDYFGSAVNRAARLMSAGHGGQVLVSAATAGILGRSGLLDLGEHRLRDLAEPQRVFQLGSQSFPALRGLDAAPSNLPVQATELVGRRLLVAEVCDLLLDRRAVTLTGVGGVGKTRLAVQVGAEVLPKFSDGVWFIDLAPVAHEEMVLVTIAEVLAVSPQSGEPLITTVLSRLEGKQVLVILDNCEHVVTPVARFVERVAATASEARVLATSREALGLPVEQVRPVPPLAEDTDAVELFVQHAVHADPSFDPGASLQAVHEICRRLDGIPLAIELAAARSRHMSVEQIAERLDQRFRLLTGGARTAIERHRTLQATVAWSYDLLDPGDQLVFQRLSVMAGSFDLGAAEAVAAGGGTDAWEVVDALGRLVDKSMLSTVRTDSELRYRFLETLRQFASDRLMEAPDHDEVRDRYAHHWCERAAELRPVSTPTEAELNAVERDIDHYRAAFAQLLTSSDAESPARALLALSAFWQMRHTNEGLAWSEQFLLHQLSVASRLGILGFAAHAAGTLVPMRAMELAREAVATAEAQGLKPPWDAYQAMMLVATGNGDVATHDEVWPKAAAAAAETGNHFLVLLNATQRTSFSHELTDETAEHYERLLPEIKAIGSPLLLSLAYVNYGASLFSSGSIERGIRLLRMALDQAEKVGPLPASGIGVLTASACVLVGDAGTAATTLKRPLVLARDLGQTHVVAEAAKTAALIAVENGDLDLGASLTTAARRQLDKVGLRGSRLPNRCSDQAEAILSKSLHDVTEARARASLMTIEDLVNTALEVLDRETSVELRPGDQ
jgi:predicted ATPase/class 3 adenylate cyclase